MESLTKTDIVLLILGLFFIISGVLIFYKYFKER